MPPKTRKTKEEESGDEDDKAGATGGSDLGAVLMLMQHQMQQMQDQRKADEQAQQQRMQAQEQRMLQHMQDQQKQMFDLMQAQMDKQADVHAQAFADLRANPPAGGGGGGGGAAKPRRIDQPKLRGPTEVTLADFRDFCDRFNGFLEVSALDTEPTAKNRITYLKSSVDESWTKLWSGGMLDVDDADDVTDILDKMYAHLRRHRNPLLDRKEFFARDQRQGESITEYLAGLTRIYESCSYDDTHECSRCHRDAGIAKTLRD